MSVAFVPVWVFLAIEIQIEIAIAIEIEIEIEIEKTGHLPLKRVPSMLSWKR
jgi:hypothetical protein